MKRTIWCAGLLAILVIGCSDLEGPSTEIPQLASADSAERPVAASNDEDFKTSNMVGRVWFDIEFDVGPTLKPNEPIQIDVTYAANFATDAADLRITLPEVESAKLSA